MHGSENAAGLRRSEPLLERDGELGTIEDLVRAAASGDARLVLVEGPAGIGKTRLLAEARRRGAALGVHVVSARGSELEREFPFGVVRQLFEAELVDPDADARLLAGSAAGARPIFAPPDPSGEPGMDASFAALHGLYWVTANLATGRPLLLAIDDLHWCDRASLRFLAYLVRRLEGLPVLVAASMRTAEPGADAALLAELARDPLTVPLLPAPLSVGAAAELIAERLAAAPDPAFTAACHGATGGNPLLLHEVLRAMESEGVRPDAAHVGVLADLAPRAASRAVVVRLSRLSEVAVAVARAAAVLGDGAEIQAVAALADVGEEAAEEAFGELVRVEILRPDPPLAFVHPLVRDAVLHDVALGERERRHARAARLLAEAGAADEQVAAQLLATPGRGEPWVVETLTRAAREAMARGAPDSAVAYLRRAVDEPPPEDERGELLFQLGAAEGLTSGPAAAEHLVAAWERAEAPAARARVAAVLVPVLTFLDRPAEAGAIVERALAELGPGGGDLRQRLDAHRLSISHWDPRYIAVDDPACGNFGPPQGDGAGALMLAAVAAYDVAIASGRAEASAEVALQAVAGGRLVRLENGSVAQVAALLVLVLADRDEALVVSQDAMAASHASGSLFAAAAAYVFRGFTLLCRGDLEEAERLLRLAADHLRAWGFESVRVYPASYLARVLIERGDLEGARRALYDVAAVPGELTNTHAYWWLWTRLELLVAEGRLDEALEAAADLERRAAEVAIPPWIAWRSLRAEALRRLGRDEEAVLWAEAELQAARVWGAPRVVGQALRLLGAATGGEEGERRLREAVAVLEASPARLELAKAYAALGTALRHARRPTEAREPLQRALELAGACSAGRLVEGVRGELLAAGGRPRAGAQAGVGALTPSERRVADLAIEGLSNRDIAQALYVTPKTVEVHLSSAYRKLGIRSRRGLGDALASSATKGP
jgi:DNA-binding CsgD family transcriptional regulator